MPTLYNRLFVENIKIRYALIVIILVIWIGQILWVAKDISTRTQSTFFQIICIVIATFGLPLIWWVIYLMIRPWQTLDQQMSYEAHYPVWPVCLTCKSENLESSNYCVFCGDILKITCPSCDYKYYREYLYCPKCGSPTQEPSVW